MKPFAGNGARASELIGAMLNVQLDRIDGIDRGDARREEARSSRAPKRLGNLGLKLSPMNSPDHDCATHVMYHLPSAEAASRFAKIFPSVIAGKTGRHTYTEWDQVLMRHGRRPPGDEPLQHADNAGLPAHLLARTCAPARSTSSTGR